MYLSLSLVRGKKTSFSTTDGDVFHDLFRLNYDAKRVESVIIEHDVDETFIDEFLESYYENNDYSSDDINLYIWLYRKDLITNTK